VSYPAGSGCSGRPGQSIPVPDMCFAASDDDDDSSGPAGDDDTPAGAIDDIFNNDDHATPTWDDDFFNNDHFNDDHFPTGDDDRMPTGDDDRMPSFDDDHFGGGGGFPTWDDDFFNRGGGAVGKHSQHISDRAGEAVLQQARNWLHGRAVASDGILSSKHHAPASVQKNPKHRAQLSKKAKAAHPAAVNAVPLAAVPYFAPTAAPDTDDVNYDDQDDADDQTFEYDDYVYVYEHDDQDFGGQTNYGGDDDISFLNPPPSVSTTAFPTSTTEANPAHSMRMMCKSAPRKKDATFTVKQVRRRAAV
jgi:hypothetical protein